MKVKLCILLALVILCLSGCAETERTWEEDFTVQCRHIEESQFADPNAKLDALLNGTFVAEQDEYTVTNNTFNKMKSVKLIFRVEMSGYEPFEFEQHIGSMNPRASAVRSVTESWVMMEMGITSFPDGFVFDFDDCRLIRIEYEIEE